MNGKQIGLRLVTLLLAVLLVAVSLTACQKQEEGESTTTSGTEQTTTSVPAQTGPEKLDGTPIELTEEFVLVSSDKDNDALLILANEVKKKIKNKTNVTVGLGHAGTVKEKEIILGYSDQRAACTTAYADLGSEDIAIYTEGTTAVLSAWDIESMRAAIDLMLDTALVQENGKWMLYPYRVTDEASIKIGIDLSQYRIVYSETAGSYLKKTVLPYLQDQIRAVFGVTLKAVTDNEAPSDYEIVLGETNRTTDGVRNQLDANDYLRYVIAAEGNRIHLFSRADVMLYSAAEKMCEYATPELGPSVFFLRAEPVVSDTVKSSDKIELAEGADIRVMSYNILHPSWSNVTTTVPVEGRDANMAKILMYYMPDVVGLQEVNINWHKAIKKLLIDTELYASACQKKRNGSDYNLTTFLYNPRTVKLIDEYVLDLDNNSNIRVLSVAVFEKLSDGTRFVVTNTHPAPGSQAANYKRNFADMMTLMKQELEKYKDLPFIMTGDFNTKEQDSMYTTFINTIGVKDAKYDAETLVRDYSTFLSPAWGGTIIKGNRSCIDHIFVNAKADAKLFNVVIDHNVAKTSDHIPIYADIDLK